MLHEELSKRILILDGAMGTVLEKYFLKSEDFCGAAGCYEILNETRADIILEVHKKYIEAGADIIETNSFNCNAISLKEYQLKNKVYSLAKKSGEIDRKSTRLNSSHANISYAVFCLKKKKIIHRGLA